MVDLLDATLSDFSFVDLTLADATGATLEDTSVMDNRVEAACNSN